MELLGIIDEISALVWTRRYWECGEFSLLVPMTLRHAALLQNGRLIARKDTDELGQIRYFHVTRDENGLEQIEVQGKFLTHWIGNRLLLNSIVSTSPSHLVLLTARGHLVLDQKTESLSFSSHIDTHANLTYKTDFDLGDRVTCINKRWGIRIDARITEITESYESGKEELEITFGVSIPSLSAASKGR